jgi:tetratricopeptide (TPR) repeat protein
MLLAVRLLRFDSCRRGLGALALASGVYSAAAPARAQVPIGGGGAETSASSARFHFDRALELYRAGKYALALTQLSRAAELDPDGKDLFFNLALVHEKLGQLPQAISALERYRELETESAERERARLSIDRLRGAIDAQALAAATPRAPCPEPEPPAPPERKPNVALIGAASLSIVSLAVGVVFGVKALSDDVSGASTSPSVSIEQLRERGRRAEREALVADVAFAVSAVAAGTFVGVWMLTPADSPERGAGVTLRSYF